MSIWLRIFIKFLQLIVCITSLIFKKLTDKHAMRVFIRNQKYSREWSLLNNLTWSQEGNDFSIVTYGGYLLITAAIFISTIVERDIKRHMSEQILLICGVIFFGIQAFLVFTSVEYIPIDLELNAYILGGLTFLAAFLFLIDLCYTPQENYGFEQKYKVAKKLTLDDTVDFTIKRAKLKTDSQKIKTPKEHAVVEQVTTSSRFPSIESLDNVSKTRTLQKDNKFLCEDIEKRKRWINGKVHTLKSQKDRPMTSDPYKSVDKYSKSRYFNTDV